jgi:acyl-CoA thioesterase 8
LIFLGVKHADILADEESGPQHKRARMFVRVKGKISGGHEAHLTALAYMSDSFFIGTVARAHKLWRNFPPQGDKDQDRIDMIHGTKDPREKPGKLRLIDMGSENLKAREESSEREQDEDERPEIGMMVSLDHTIYFHNPRDFRADQWMLEEMETPWSGDHRGLVMQRIWSSEGKLVATCIQEVSSFGKGNFLLLAMLFTNNRAGSDQAEAGQCW